MTTATGHKEYQNRMERITDRARIAGLLLRAKETRALLSVSLDRNASYSSAVIGLDLENDVFALDELNPREGHDRVREAQKIFIRTAVQHVDLYFETEVLKVSETAGVGIYTARVPAQIWYGQQRQHFRAPVGYDKTIPVVMTREDGDSLMGELKDISVGGIGTRLRSSATGPVSEGEHIPNCTIALTSANQIVCEVEVRFAMRPLAGEQQILGARFLQLTPAQERAIAEVVVALERELLKKGARS